MIPERSTAAKAALDVFFEGQNDVHFYVEDTGQRNLYKAFLKRLFPKLKLSQIFPLDGKPNVLRHAQDVQGNNSIKAPRVYILDKDFDDILGSMVLIPNVFYLKKYCIENYVIESEAIIDFIIEVSPKSDRASLESSVSCDQFITKSLVEVEPLFRVFCLVQKYGLGLPNAKQVPERFIYDTNRDEIDPIKVQNYRNIIAQELKSKGIITTNSEFENLIKNIFPGKKISERHVSGKFLLKLVQLHLKKNKHIGNVGDDIMLFSLARNARIRSLRELGIRIRRYLQTHKQ